MRQSFSAVREGIRTITLAVLLGACSNSPDLNVVPQPPIDTLPNAFAVQRLVANNAAGNAAVIDPNLINPWGIVFGPTGILWSANNVTGTATLYSATGARQSLVVQIPSDAALSGGRPTGIIFNPTQNFAIAGSGPAEFIFASEDGIISAWNTSTGTNAMRMASRASSGSVYKAMTLASSGGVNFLYATDFRNNAVDVFDVEFNYVRSFTDFTVPEGFAPFGIQNVAGKLYVTYARQQQPGNMVDLPGVGAGFVNVLNPDGTLNRRFASTGSLNSPLPIAVAPAGFGPFAGAILIGNAGDGKIGAYNATTGAFIDFLRDNGSVPIVIPGLRGLAFGPTMESTTLYFSAGPGGGTAGLIGTISP